MTAKEQRSAFALQYLDSLELKTAANRVGLEVKPELLEKCQEELERYRRILGRQITREDVIRRLARLGFGSGGECISLLDGSWHEEGLDLSLVSEVRKNANGGVEFKLIDRVSVLRQLLELLSTEEDGAEAFLRALQAEESGNGD